MQGMAAVGWTSMMVGLAILDKAKPTHAQFFDRYFYQEMNIPFHEKTTWDSQLLFYLFIALCVGLVTSLFGLLLNAWHHHRKDDYYRFYLWFLLSSSAIGIIWYWF